MKKKIKYGDIEPADLNVVLGEDYFHGDYTLKDELDKYGEDIIAVRYCMSGITFSFFHAWTKSYALVLINDLMGEKVILGIERNPPKKERIKYARK